MPVHEVTIADALLRRFPEWVFFLIARGPGGPPNLMPAGWGMLCSHEPPMFAVAVRATNHSAGQIEQSGEFVVAFLAERHVRHLEPAGTTSGRDQDKFAALGLETMPAARVRPPLLADAPLQFECRLAGRMQTGDHIVFAGEIVAAHVGDVDEPKVENFRRHYVPARPAEPWGFAP